MTATTPREALAQIRLISGVLLKHEINAILTALREGGHLRTPGTVEVCERWPSVHCSDRPNRDAGRSLCTQRTCPLKQVTNEKA